MDIRLSKREGFIVQLKNDLESFDALFNTVSDYYEKNNRSCVIFETNFLGGDMEPSYFIRFLVDRKNVIEYKVAQDRGMLLSILSLGIGPHYFTPADFWNYEKSKLFKMEASTDAIFFNLSLLDNFLHPLRIEI